MVLLLELIELSLRLLIFDFDLLQLDELLLHLLDQFVVFVLHASIYIDNAIFCLWLFEKHLL